VAEQRYQAVLAVISDGLSISQVAEKVGVSRQTLHSWLARYEAQGLEGLVDRSHRPVSCPYQMPAVVEAALLELRRSRPYWGPRRLVSELGALRDRGARRRSHA
jgi:transposase